MRTATPASAPLRQYGRGGKQMPAFSESVTTDPKLAQLLAYLRHMAGRSSRPAPDTRHR